MFSELGFRIVTADKAPKTVTKVTEVVKTRIKIRKIILKTLDTLMEL
jgi:hypothetical protein